MNIDIARIHKCTEECKYTHFLQFRSGKNPDYNESTNQCALFNQKQLCSPSINDWLNQKDQFNLESPNEIVIPEQKISIAIDYPVRDRYTFDFDANTEQGFTREFLIDCICSQYKKIYEEENAVCKVSSIDERMRMGGLINRESTDGPYGIWGHDIDDLYLEGITYHASTKMVILSIGS